MSGESLYKSFIRELTEFSKEILLLQKKEELFSKIGEFTLKNLECENLVIWVWNKNDEVLVPMKYWGLEKKEIEGHSFKRGEGIVGTSFDSGKPVYEKDLKKSELFVKKGNVVNRIRDIMMVPIFKDDIPYGVFDVSNKKKGVFNNDDMNKTLMISSLTSICFYVNERDSEILDNISFFKFIMKILDCLKSISSDMQFFGALKDVFEKELGTKCSIRIKRSGIEMLSMGEKIKDIYLESGEYLENEDSILFYYDIQKNDVYISLSEKKNLDFILKSNERYPVFKEILNKTFHQFYTERAKNIKNSQLDLLYRMSLNSLSSEKSTEDLLFSFTDEIYNSYKLYSFEIYKREKKEFVKIISEGIYRREDIIIPADSEIIETLQMQDIFILNCRTSNEFPAFILSKNIKDETVSFFATLVKDEREIKYVMIFRWDEIFSPEMNFFNFIDLLKTEIIEKERTVDLLSKLKTTTEETIKLLIDLLKYKDPEIIDHCERVSFIANVITNLFKLKLDPMDLNIASFLHDIGKIAIDDKILKSDKTLNEDEFEKIRKHSRIGFDFVKSYDYNTSIKEVVLHHHEKWDGTGYPDGLKENEIPLLVRVMTLSDTIDAILSERTYKESSSFDKLKKILKEESGKMYDPLLITLMMKNWDIFTERIKGLYE